MKVTRCTLRQTSRSTITVHYHLQIPIRFSPNRSYPSQYLPYILSTIRYSIELPVKWIIPIKFHPFGILSAVDVTQPKNVSPRHLFKLPGFKAEILSIPRECTYSRSPWNTIHTFPEEITITYGNSSNASSIRPVADYKILRVTKSRSGQFGKMSELEKKRGTEERLDCQRQFKSENKLNSIIWNMSGAERIDVRGNGTRAYFTESVRKESCRAFHAKNLFSMYISDIDESKSFV